MQMADFYKQFCKVEFDDNGVIKAFAPVYSDNFNFAYDVIDKIAELEPTRRAMVWCNDSGEDKTFTYGELSALSNQAANLFRAQGVVKGDKVMLVLKRHYQFWIAILALHKLGAIAIPAMNLLTVKDLDYRFNAAEVSHIVCTADGDVSQFIDETLATYTGMKSKMIVRGKRDGWVSFDDEMAQQSKEFARVETNVEEYMLLYFTSGTTGYPKMVIHKHHYPIGHIITAKFWHNMQPDGLHLTVSDTGWAKCAWGKLYGQWFTTGAIFVYDMDKFEPSELLKRIEQYKITSFCAPPTIYRFFIKVGMEGYDFSSVKYATTAGEALNPEVYNRFLERTGLKIMEAFGQTETTPMTLNPVGTTPKIGSMGKPSPLYDIALIDDDGENVPPGEVGELCIRLKDNKGQVGLFDGYYKDTELTKKVWHDGFYHTGDTAWKDEDGFYWYVGRNDDVIKASGYRIGPFEIESVLMEHPSVLECAVTGAPDPIRGIVVKATIVLTKDFAPSDELIKELQEYVKKTTAPYKYPRIVEFVPELPKTISGKIKRAEIRNSAKN